MDAERPVRIGGPKVRTLLAALLVDANKVVPASHLCTALWSDADPAGQLNALQTQVSRLRAVVAPSTDPRAERRLLSRGQGYVLSVDGDELDATAFESLSREARDAFAAEDWTTASRRSEAALALWRGVQALDEYRYEEFARSRAAQLDEQRLLTIECRVNARLALGHHRELTGDLEELVGQHPLREQLWCQLMLALYRSDRQSEALRAYERVRLLLADELGINPCAELVRLERAVLDQDPALDWQAPAPSDAGRSPEPLTAIERDGHQRAAEPDPPVDSGRPVTFLLTDVEHSTLLWDRDPVAMAEALRVHDGVLREAIESHDGRVFGRPGDGFFAVFDRAADSTAAALRAQRGLRAVARTENDELRVRIAIHTGEAEQREGNFFGAAVNRVARLRDAAHGGQVVVSATTRELVVDALPTEATLTDIGTWLFEGLSRAERVYQLDHPRLDSGFPPLRSGRPHTGTMPRHLTSFVGRQHESERTVAALWDGPLVTLVGEGGVGKTRLALEILQRATVADYPDGVWFCDVSLVDDAEGLAEAMAAALKLSTPPGSNVRATVVGALRHARLLLLIDNSERLRDAVADLVAEILSTGPEATILATSRAPLRTNGEQVIQLDPLGLPNVDHAGTIDVTTAPAVRLLLDRAHSAGASVAEDDPALADIAHRLDGMPLAIELAAPRLAIMSPAALATRLDRSFDLLSAPALPARQRTMRATIDWSFELLSDEARRLFGTLSVFRGGFTLDTAEMIATAADLHPDAVAPLIADLADQSMIRAELPAHGSARYRMLDTMLAYAADHLVATGLHDAVYVQHAHYFVDLAERANLKRRGPLEPAWVAEIAAEFDNLRAAYRWSVDAGDPGDALRLVAALMDDATMRERFEIGRWAAELADLPALSDQPRRSVALALAGNTAMMEYRLDDARRLSLEALAIEEAADITPSWIAHNTLAMLRAAEGSDEYRQHLHAMVEISAATGDPTPAAVADYNRSLFAVLLGQPERGTSAAERLLALSSETGNPTIRAMALVAHGQAVSATEPELAARRYHEALAAAASAQNTLVAQHCLRAIEALKARSGDQPASLASLRAIAQRFEQSGNVAEQLQTVISMLDSLVALDALTAAATICGALSQTPGRFTAICQLIDRTVAEKLPPEEYLAARRIGATMPPAELVTFASGLVKELS